MCFILTIVRKATILVLSNHLGGDFMKRRILSLFLVSVILLIALPSCQKESNGRTSDGNDEIVTLLLLSKISGVDSGGSFTAFSCSYDSQGNAKEIKVNADSRWGITYNYPANNSVEMRLDGTEYVVISYTFTKDGKPTEAVYFDDEGTERAKEVYSYDDHGNVVLIVMYENGEQSDGISYTYEYDNKGKILSMTSSEQGRYTTTYTYDEDGKLLESATAFKKTVFEYDKKGNLLTRTTYSSDGDLLQQDSFTYDSQGCTKTGPRTGEYHYTAVKVTRKQAEKLINQYTAMHKQFFFGEDYAFIKE